MARTKLINELENLVDSIATIEEYTSRIKMMFEMSVTPNKVMHIDTPSYETFMEHINETLHLCGYTKDDIQDLIDGLERIDD